MIKIFLESDKFSHKAGVTKHATNILARKSHYHYLGPSYFSYVVFSAYIDFRSQYCVSGSRNVDQWSDHRNCLYFSTTHSSNNITCYYEVSVLLMDQHH